MPSRAPSATGIGSSQIAALVGLHPYRKLLDVFNALAFGVTARRVAHLAWGQKVEPAILAYRLEQLGETAQAMDTRQMVERFGPRYLGGLTVRARSSAIAIASADAVLLVREAWDDPERLRPLETKNVGWTQARHWGDDDDETPPGYRLQNLWQQGCLDADGGGELCATIGGAPPETWPVPWDQATWENLVTIAERFWRNHVLTRRPPVALSDDAASADYLRAAFPEEAEGVPLLPAGELEKVIEEWAAADDAWASAEKQARTLERQLCARIGDGLGFQLGDGRRLTWRAQNTASGGRTRVLRMLKAPGTKRR